jgi:hypothetical protein
MNNRVCGECTKCCEGYLTCTVKGQQLGNGNACHYLGSKCTIYEERPEHPCKTYKCEWLADLQFPEWMKPSLSKVIINKIKHNNVEFYSLIDAGTTLDIKFLNWMIHWALNNDKNLFYKIEGGFENRIGSKEFLNADLTIKL